MKNDLFISAVSKAYQAMEQGVQIHDLKVFAAFEYAIKEVFEKPLVLGENEENDKMLSYLFTKINDASLDIKREDDLYIDDVAKAVIALDEVKKQHPEITIDFFDKDYIDLAEDLTGFGGSEDLEEIMEIAEEYALEQNNKIKGGE